MEVADLAAFRASASPDASPPYLAKSHLMQTCHLENYVFGQKCFCSKDERLCVEYILNQC